MKRVQEQIKLFKGTEAIHDGTNAVCTWHSRCSKKQFSCKETKNFRKITEELPKEEAHKITYRSGAIVIDYIQPEKIKNKFCTNIFFRSIQIIKTKLL